MSVRTFPTDKIYACLTGEFVVESTKQHSPQSQDGLRFQELAVSAVESGRTLARDLARRTTNQTRGVVVTGATWEEFNQIYDMLDHIFHHPHDYSIRVKNPAGKLPLNFSATYSRALTDQKL